jgi:hypothetical protein
MEDVHIVRINPEDWKDFRDLRLKMIQTDPAAYAHRYDESVNLYEGKWREILMKTLFIGAKLRNERVGMVE